MNKTRFLLLIILMSLSLVGIILVQLFWINTSYKNNEEQFKYHVQQVIGSVANKLQQQEYFEFYEKFNKLKDSIGKVPRQSDLLEYFYVKRDPKTNEQIIYSNTIVLEDYNLNRSFFDKRSDSVSLKSFVAKRKTEIYNGNVVDNAATFQKAPMPDVTIEKEGNLDILDKAQFEIYFKDIVGLKPIQERVSKEKLHSMLQNELSQYGVNTPFEFGIYSNMLATKVK
ncbi:MAG: two-component sensor histidine kinase, partial [Flavobacterium sp.]|nr:two-component sensor histidine kinase [Flavobacterium sp.]